MTLTLIIVERIGKKKKKKKKKEEIILAHTHLDKGKTLPNECPGNNTKHSDGEVPVMLGLWRIRSTPSLPLFPGQLWPGVVALDRALSMG